MGHVVRGTYYVLVVGKSMAKQRQFLCQNVDQMVAMPPSSVINPLATAGALTRMAMNLWGLEQTEDVLVELKVCINEICINWEGDDNFNLISAIPAIFHFNVH